RGAAAHHRGQDLAPGVRDGPRENRVRRDTRGPRGQRSGAEGKPRSLNRAGWRASCRARERRNMADVPKHIKRLLREHAATAHEEELRRALLPISEAFGRWARSELGSGELAEIIHRFHQGPARELWVRYNTSPLEMPVAFAITT